MRKVLSLGMAWGIGFLGSLVSGSEIDDANRLFMLEKYDGAIRIYEKVASDESGEAAAEALFGIGRAYQMLGRWKLARDGFQSLLRQHSDSDLTLKSKIQIGQCEIRLGNVRKALAVFQEIEEGHTGEEAAIEATYNIANLDAGFFGGDVRNARAAIKAYLRVLGSGEGKRYAVQSHFGLGQCYMLLQDYRRAMESFRAVVEKGPDTVWAGYARDQVMNALRAFGEGPPFKKLGEFSRQDEQDWRRPLYPVIPSGPSGHAAQEPTPLRYFRTERGLAWEFPDTRPKLRIYAIGFFTEQPGAGSKALKVFYSRPTIYYKNYVFRSDRGTVDRGHRSVECTGQVRCTDNIVPPTLTVTSGALILDLRRGAAAFSHNVRLERRTGTRPAQRLLVEELHLSLDSGKIEIPPATGE